MGTEDDAAAVDGKLLEFERLRVVGGNINAPLIMIAEKAADLIRGYQPAAPVNV